MTPAGASPLARRGQRMTRPPAPLAGVRIIECSMLGPGAITTHLADLGADVIKVEPPQGDYIRQMTWPIVEGTSLMHLHISRGKRSIVLDLRTARASRSSSSWCATPTPWSRPCGPAASTGGAWATRPARRSTRGSCSAPSRATA